MGKEMTVMTLTAAVEPAGREKIKLKGRQLLPKHNRDHIGVAVGHDAQDTGFLSGEAEIFVKVDDYSTNPNAHRDPQTGQWYVFDPVTKKCKWVVDDEDPDKILAHSNKLRANLNKTLAGNGNLKRVQSLCRLRQKGDAAAKKKKGRQPQSSSVSSDVHFKQGEGDIFARANQDGVSKESEEKNQIKP